MEDEARVNLANVHRRLDYLQAHGRSMPRASIGPIPRRGGPSPCRVCGVINCANPECFRTILIRHRLSQHATAAERDATGRRNGHGRA